MRGKLCLSIVDALIQLAIGPPLAALHPRGAPHRALRRAPSPRLSPRPSPRPHTARLTFPLAATGIVA
jgi:hypothetical protein